LTARCWLARGGSVDAAASERTSTVVTAKVHTRGCQDRLYSLRSHSGPLLLEFLWPSQLSAFLRCPFVVDGSLGLVGEPFSGQHAFGVWLPTTDCLAGRFLGAHAGRFSSRQDDDLHVHGPNSCAYPVVFLVSRVVAVPALVGRLAAGI